MPKNKRKQPLKLFYKPDSLVVIFLVFILVLLVKIGLSYYRDQSTKSYINALEKNFPILVRDLEKRSGKSVDVTSNCLEKSEFFNGHMYSCMVAAELSLSLRLPIDEIIRFGKTEFETISMGNYGGIEEGFLLALKGRHCRGVYQRQKAGNELKILLSCSVNLDEKNKIIFEEKLPHNE